MRRSPLVLAALILTAGCRAPAIPAHPGAREYKVYSDWIEYASSTLPRDLNFTVDASTLPLSQAELQYQQCLPPRMETVFDNVPSTTLTASSSNDWINISDGRRAELHAPGTPIAFTNPTELFRLSRVAFTRSAYDAYLWVEHRTCHPATSTAAASCDGASGALLHGQKSDGLWSFEETICHTISFLPDPAPSAQLPDQPTDPTAP